MKHAHRPDILDCIAHLSSDEVMTPPVLAKAMLDLLPSDVWTNKDLKWLDPFSKSGVFLREIAKRLNAGLAAEITDETARLEHIYMKMLFGTSISALTGEMSRRTLYCSRDASSPEALVRFDDPSGNLPFVQTSHHFKKQKAPRCTKCGAPPGLERGLDRENYAYSFIHGTYPTKELKDVKFDVIVGNPPYQLGTEGHGATASSIYHLFVEQAFALNPKYVLMIIPSRWFGGGKGLDDFRTKMIADRRLAKIVDNPKLFDCFPGVEIKGGVNYFLWDRDHDGDCEFSSRIDGKIVSTMSRDLRGGDGVLMRDNRAVAIVAKAKTAKTVEQICSIRKPFGVNMMSNFTGSVSEPFEGSIPLIYNNKIGYSRPDQIERNHDWIDKYKVLIPKAGDGHGREVSYVLGEPIAVAPGSACTQSYIVAGMFDDAQSAENYAHYLCSKFVRFLVLQRKPTQDVRPSVFRFVPMLDMSRRWTDADLYAEFKLTPEEVAYIEGAIHPREPILSLNSPIPASHLPGGHKYKTAVDDADDEDEEA